MNNFLHVGCGPAQKTQLKGFCDSDWNEIRFDIDVKAKPDIIGTLTDMHEVKNASVDAIFSSHNIEHVFPHEVDIVFNEFHRVLNKDGFLVITCPDLQAISQAIAEDKLEEPLYISPAGPICPIDILYGHRVAIANGNVYMAHKTGFTYKTMANYLVRAGFLSLWGGRRGEGFYDLWFVASKSIMDEAALHALARKFTPFQ